MFQLLYTSQAIETFNLMDLTALVLKSQVYNSFHGLTGMLIYEDGVFTQVLEGNEVELEIIMEKIMRDPPHHKIRVIKREPIEYRNYSYWMMVFKTESLDQLVRIA